MTDLRQSKSAIIHPRIVWLVEDDLGQITQIGKAIQAYFERQKPTVDVRPFENESSFRKQVEQLVKSKSQRTDWPTVIISDVMLPFASENDVNAEWLEDMQSQEPQLMRTLMGDKNAYQQAGTRNRDFLREREKQMGSRRTPFIYYSILSEDEFPYQKHRDKWTRFVQKSEPFAKLCSSIAEFLDQEVGLHSDWPESDETETRRLSLQRQTRSKLIKGAKTPLSETVPLRVRRRRQGRN